MRQSLSIWSGGVLGSVLTHMGFAALLLWSLQPDPVDHQPSPQGELQMQAYRVPHSEAIPQQAQGETAAQKDARGEDVAAGTVPQSSARPVAAQGSRLEESQPQATVLNAALDPLPQVDPVAVQINKLSQSAVEPAKLSAATMPVGALAPTAAPTSHAAAAARPTASAIAAAALPTPEASTAAQPTPVLLASASVQPLLAPAMPPDTADLVSTALTSIPSRQQNPDVTSLTTATASADPASQLAPDTAPLALAKPVSAASPEQRPDTTVISEQAPPLVSAIPSKPEVPFIKAALAFSGEDSGQADPVSLAAFQSFMRPGDVAASGDPLRDGVMGILAAVPCSRLQVQFDPETATLNLRGHLPENGLRAPVLAALQAQMGANIQVSDQMKLLPRPQCGALAGISNVGLPQSTDQITNPLLIGADTHARVLDYVKGDPMFFDLTAPDYDAYVYVDYFDAGGAVLHLTPNEVVPLTLSTAQSQLRVGAKNPGDPGLQIEVGPPYGQEIAVAYAASHPLYSGLRPISEEAAPYLAWLSQRVSETRAIYPDFKGEWVYFFVSTSAQ